MLHNKENNREIIVKGVVENYVIKVHINVSKSRESVRALLDAINKGLIKPRENTNGEVVLINDHYTFVAK